MPPNSLDENATYAIPEMTGQAINSLRGESLLLSTDDAALLLNLSKSSVHRLVMSGKIQSVKVGRRRLGVRAGLEAFIERMADEEIENRYSPKW